MKTLGCAKDTIKEIEFEDYVAIVVASEIGNAPLEACKAQAVAARSYAIAAGVLNDKVISDNSSSAQACRFNRTSYANANAAAKATVGEVLTYNDQVISAIYTDTNGGRTVSSEEKWGGYRVYLIAQDDPWDAASGKPKSGHGVGMSQSGAIVAANQGFTYTQILNFYYPHTRLVSEYNCDIRDDEEYKRKVLEDIKVRVETALRELKKGLE